MDTDIAFVFEEFNDGFSVNLAVIPSLAVGLRFCFIVGILKRRTSCGKKCAEIEVEGSSIIDESGHLCKEIFRFVDFGLFVHRIETRLD